MIDPTKIDPSKIPDDKWEFEGFSPDGLYRTDICWLDKEQGTYFRRKVPLTEGSLVALNQQEFNDSQSQRFGDGKVVARVPLNKYFKEIAPRLQEGDLDYTKWWLNHEDNRPFRNFRGKF